MNCQETQKFIHVYLDGEFAEEDRRDFERHLRYCARCRAMARFEERFKTALRSRVSPVCPPEEMVRKVVMRVRAEPAPASDLWRWGIRVVPAGLAAALLTLLLWPKSPAAPKLATPTAERDDSAAVDPFRAGSGRVSRPAGIPALTPAPATAGVVRRYRTSPYQPAGFGGGGVDFASATPHDYTPARPPRTFSFPSLKRFWVTELPDGEFPVRGLIPHELGDTVVYFGTRGGQSVAVFRHRGRGYTITADMPLDELQELVQTMLDG